MPNSQKDKTTQRFSETIAATARALAGDNKVNLEEKKENIKSRHHLNEIRVRADAIALNHAFSNKIIHQRYRPQNHAVQQIYDRIEKIRCQFIGAAKYIGVSKNLIENYKEQVKKIEQQSMAKMQGERHQPNIDFVLALQLLNKVPSVGTHDFIKKFLVHRKKISQEVVEAETIDKLYQNIGQQEVFAQIVTDILTKITEKNEANQPKTDSEKEQQQKNQQQQTEAEKTENQQKLTESSSADVKGDIAQQKKYDDENQTEEKNNKKIGALYENSITKNSDEKYTIYTKKFDQIIEATKLCDAEELKLLRKQLDFHTQDMKKIIAGLANKLQRKLMSSRNKNWQFDCEEGIIDSARLARTIVAARKNEKPIQLSYKREVEADFCETIVTLLLDNSGSMRGYPIINAALCADILARTLERCRIRVEILGFTTVAWKGGESRKNWLKNNSPAKPGRLNDLRHIVYKPADIIYRRVKDSLGLMLQDGLLKENIDGEALIWAYSRIVKYHEKRKILIVISDGAPVDDSSIAVNDALYLDEHLRRVIYDIENKSQVEITAIGIGHDVNRYYKQAITIKDSQQLGKVLIEKVTDLFDKSKKKINYQSA